MMDIHIFFHRAVYPPRDGTTVYIDSLLKALSKHAAVNLFTYSGGKKVSSFNVKENYKVYEVPRAKIPGLYKLSNSPEKKRIYNTAVAFHPKIFQISKKISNPDFTVCFGHYPPINILLNRSQSGNLAFMANDALLPLGMKTLKHSPVVGSLMTIYASVIEKILSKNADVIFVPSEKGKKSLETYYGEEEKVHILSPCFDKKPFIEQLESEEKNVRKKHEIDENQSVLLFVGSGGWAPNREAIYYIINILAPYLEKKADNAKIMIVGRNTEEFRQEVESENVIICGEVENTVPYMLAASLGLAPLNIMGGVSIKLIHYLMSGLPVMSTPQVARTVDQETGIFVSKLKSFHLNTLDRIRDISQLESLRPQIQREAIRKYSLETGGKKLYDILRSQLD